MANTSDDLSVTQKISVEISQTSHLVFSKLRQFKEVVFWERPEIPDIIPSDQDVTHVLSIEDRVDNLAAVAYQDPILWWFLALRNGVPLPPLQMQPGFRFIVPDRSVVADVLRGR